MRDDYQLEEMSGAVSLGLLASDIAIAASKILRGAGASAVDRAALDGGEALLRALGAPLDDVRPPARLGHLGSKSSAMDALHAIQVRIPDGDVQDYVRPLADAVRMVLDGKPVSEYAKEIESVRDLFASLSEMEVSRVTNLSRPTPGRAALAGLDSEFWFQAAAVRRSVDLLRTHPHCGHIRDGERGSST